MVHEVYPVRSGGKKGLQGIVEVSAQQHQGKVLRAS
jgi:hypothetical protein